jgi:hypothetical protein
MQDFRTDAGVAQSRLMKTRFGLRQAYNAQLAVSEDHLILAAYITDHGIDVGEYIPTVAAVQQTLSQLAATGFHRDVGTVLADAGYSHERTSAHPARPVSSRPAKPKTLRHRRKQR